MNGLWDLRDKPDHDPSYVTRDDPEHRAFFLNARLGLDAARGTFYQRFFSSKFLDRCNVLLFEFDTLGHGWRWWQMEQANLTRNVKETGV